MKTVIGFENNPGLSIAMGFFDGVHQAHQVVISNAVYYAKEKGLKSAVVTFKSHPALAVLKRKPQYITTLETRLEKIEKLGVDYTYVIDFDEMIQRLTAEEYLRDYVVKFFSPKAITTGFNHSFGLNKAGTPDFLRKNQDLYGYKYFEIPPIAHNNLVISSTKIRELLMNADIDIANSILGGAFFIESVVVEGNKLGRTIGFPTANIFYPEAILKIPFGVYYSKVEFDGVFYDAVFNFGMRPTIASNSEPVLEAHILGFDKNIYGEKIRIFPLAFIREEKKFKSKEHLAHQIELDKSSALTFANSFRDLKRLF